jgi:hypothetical protein
MRGPCRRPCRLRAREGGKPILDVKLLLTQLGFRKRAGKIFTIDIVDGVLGWLGLNTATEHRRVGKFEVNPVVGVRYEKIERLVTELRGEKFHAYAPPTLSTPLGYLLPECRFRTWVFGPGHTSEAAVEIIGAISNYGLPFMRLMSQLSELCRELDKDRGHAHQFDYRRPVAWMLAGRPARARQAIDESLSRLGDRSDPAAQELRRFCDALAHRLDTP